MFKQLFHRSLAWLILMTLIVAAFVPTALLIHERGAEAHAAGDTTPSITLSESTYRPAPRAKPVTITGQGFNSGDYIAIFFDSTGNSPIGGAYCDQNGNFTTQVYLPNSSVLQGVHSIIANDSPDGGGLSAMATITYVPGLFNSVGRPGLPVQFQGAAFTANETVQVYFGGKSGTLEGSATTNSTGDLSFSFTVPTGLSAGSYPVTVVRTNQKPAQVTGRLTVFPVTMTSTPGIHSGQQVKVKLTGFLPQETVSLSWNANGGQQLTTLYMDNNGATKSSFIPPSAPPGSYTLTAIGNTSGEQISNPLNIGPGVSGGSGIPGEMITVNGGGFMANETVNIYFQAPSNGVVQTTTDSTGSFSVSLTLPMTYNSSIAYYIHADSADGNEHARGRFNFYPPTLNYNGEADYNQPYSVWVSDFAVNETVQVIWNYQQPGQFIIGTAITDSSGYANFPFFVPSTPDQSSVIVEAIGLTSGLTATATIVTNPAIYLQPDSGKTGTLVTVTGGSYGTSEPVAVTFGGTTVANVTSNPDGTFTATFIVPKVNGAGNITVQATGQTSGISLSLIFIYPPEMKVTPDVASFGDTVTLTGKHFSANALISIGLPNNPYSYTASTDANGSFTLTIPVITQNFVQGTNYIWAQDAITGATAETVLVVQ